MEQTNEEFFHDFRQELLASAEANGSFQLSEFMETVANELIETGFVEGFELCDFKAPRGMRVDGYWFNDDGVLDLFIADFDVFHPVCWQIGCEQDIYIEKAGKEQDAK